MGFAAFTLDIFRSERTCSLPRPDIGMTLSTIAGWSLNVFRRPYCLIGAWTVDRFIFITACSARDVLWIDSWVLRQ
jgi:hypothetical protein